MERGLASAFDIKFVFNKWTLGEDFLTGTLKVPAERLADPSFELLSFLGFSKADIEAANITSARAMTLEGAPHLKPRPTNRCSTAPIRAAASASATCRSRATSA